MGAEFETNGSLLLTILILIGLVSKYIEYQIKAIVPT